MHMYAEKQKAKSKVCVHSTYIITEKNADVVEFFPANIQNNAIVKPDLQPSAVVKGLDDLPWGKRTVMPWVRCDY